MRIITAYLCDKCGERFDSFEKCLEHEEQAHTEPDFFAVSQLFMNYPTQSSLYPSVLDIPMKNGSIVRYELLSLIQPPTEKESPQEAD